MIIIIAIGTLIALLVFTLIMVTISLQAAMLFAWLLIPLFVAHFAAKYYTDNFDPLPLWYIMNYGGGIACSVWFIVDFFNKNIDVGYWPIIIMIIFELLSVPLMAVMNMAEDFFFNRTPTKVERAWKATGLRLGYLIIAAAFMCFAIFCFGSCFTFGSSFIYPTLAFGTIAYSSLMIARSPKESKFVLGNEKGVSKKKLRNITIIIVLGLIVLSNIR